MYLNQSIFLLHSSGIRGNVTSIIIFSPQNLVFMVDAALMLFNRLVNKFKTKTCTSHCVDVLKASISLILFAIAELKAHLPSDKTYQKDEIIAKHFASLKGYLWHWIVCREVIGGSVFGGTLPVQSSSSSSWKIKEELEVITVVIHAHKYFDLSFVTCV